MRKHLYLIPEVYFAVFSTLWMMENYTASGNFNYFAAVVTALMLLQVAIKKQIIGIIAGSLFALFSVFMMLAVLSEFNEFEEGSPIGLLFLLRGEGLFLFSALMAVAMIILHTIGKPEPARLNVLHT